MLKQRLIVGISLIAALVGALYLDEWLTTCDAPSWMIWMLPASRSGAVPKVPAGVAMLVIGLLVVPIAAREMGRMFRAGGVMASKRWMAVAAICGLLVSALAPVGMSGPHAVALVAGIATAVLVCSLVWHIRDKELRGATAAAGAAMFGFVYLGLMFGFLLALRREHSAWVVAGVVLVTKACDTGAYFTGKAIGRHKLIPWLSPGKTWEGLFGGIALAAGAAVGGVALHRHVFGGAGVGGMGLGIAALIGGVLAVVGQAGDLLESVFKRDAGLKDSGATLPGMGGVLDVLDSILLAAPVAFWMLTPWRTGGG
jgi:phosphatidate cytidylyltransferase